MELAVLLSVQFGDVSEHVVMHHQILFPIPTLLQKEIQHITCIPTDIIQSQASKMSAYWDAVLPIANTLKLHCIKVSTVSSVVDIFKQNTSDSDSDDEENEEQEDLGGRRRLKLCHFIRGMGRSKV